ncbi:MAG: DUF2062 domain-containing protein [Desulfofustis sp.]|jgi:hypothetical protein|nr:DUF2062 domain-containing protein [Desulfofustis sp.]
MNIVRTGKYYFLKLLRLRGSPKSIALGTAIGIFIGITPTIPFHTVAIIALTIVTRSSFIAAFIASMLISNPFTVVPQYSLSLVIGNALTPYHLDWERIRQVLDVVLSDAALQARIEAVTSLSYEAITVLLVGGTILALPFSVAGYYLFLFLIVSFRKRRSSKHVLH